jgi:thioredoxin-related protein
MPSCLSSKAAKSFNNPAGIVMDRRQFSSALAATLVATAGLAHAKDTALPVPTSLPQAAQASKAQGQPLVLLISLPGCVYCEMVRRNYLMPLLADTGLQAWQLDSTNSSARLMGFDGQATSAAAQAQVWKATFTPTVLFLGSQGQELAERLVGIAVPDFYGAYLDQRLAEAHKALQVHS